MSDESLRSRSLEILAGLGSCPAVSFQEHLVAAYVRSTLEGMGLPVEADRYGNLIVHRRAKGGADKGGHPPLALVAHMDHPGFEVVEVQGEVVVARALGGVPQESFSEAVPLQVVLPGGRRLGARTAGRYGAEDQRMVTIQLEEDDSIDLPSAVVFDLTDFRFDGELLHMRALDDLAGCASAMMTLEFLMDDETAGDVYGVFTRAEEVGLIGARLLAEEGTLPRDTLVVSLEASRTLPGAAIGEGPVIRVGDASLTFDAEAESVLLKAREELSEREPGFKAQRQLMSGGTCEASAFRFYGYRTTGIAFPLGNYHNAAPDGGVAAEYIHINDFIGGVQLAVQAACSVGRRGDAGPWRRFREVPEDYRRRLIADS